MTVFGRGTPEVAHGLRGGKGRLSVEPVDLLRGKVVVLRVLGVGRGSRGCSHRCGTVLKVVRAVEAAGWVSVGVPTPVRGGRGSRHGEQ